jgi:hypothetical protein
LFKVVGNRLYVEIMPVGHTWIDDPKRSLNEGCEIGTLGRIESSAKFGWIVVFLPQTPSIIAHVLTPAHLRVRF